MLFAHPIQHVLQLVIVQIGERILRKLDRRGGLVRIAELEKEESMRGLAGHSPEGEEARGRVVVLFIRHSCLTFSFRYDVAYRRSYDTSDTMPSDYLNRSSLECGQDARWLK